jgi:ubiquinone/menaquinone biosynthesis C-methylase UbiE
MSDVDDAGERVDLTREDFDRAADTFRGAPHQHVLREHLERYRWVRERVSGRVLDVACGTGYGTGYLSETCEAVGFDRDPTALARAAVRAPAAEFIQGDLPHLPFEDASFDFAVSFETIEHVDDDLTFLRQLRRVVRPNGGVVVSSPVRERPYLVRPPNQWPVREYTPSELESALRKTGFVPVGCFGQGIRSSRFAAVQAERVLYRLPQLCRPGRWWDRMIHGNDEVEVVRAKRRPKIVIFICRTNE